MNKKFLTTSKTLALGLVVFTLAACSSNFEVDAKNRHKGHSSAKCDIKKVIKDFERKANGDLQRYPTARFDDEFYDEKIFTYANGSLNMKDYQDAIDKGQLVPCHVFRVYDGDTATCEFTNGETTRVRFLGIDAPEAKQYQGKEAGDWLRKEILNRKVYIDRSNTDIYKRVLSTVYLDGVNIDYQLVRKGYVFTYARNNKNDKSTAIYASALLKAMADKVGMWSDKVDICRLEDPYNFRHK